MAAQPPRLKLPPLTALRAFEAAGRLGGFAPAAVELGVTPAAVTAHLKTLESSLGVELFERRHRGVTLTPLAARALPEFSAAFRALDAAMQQLERASAPDMIRIAAPADLAQLWLSPRLPALRAAGFDVVVLPPEAPKATRGLADLVLGLMPGEGAPLVAVAAPGLALPAAPEVLDPRATLVLQGPAGDWAAWARAAGIGAFRPLGAVHTSAPLALEEAANGAGVLVILRPLAETALAQGRLVVVFGVEAPSGLSPQLRLLNPGEVAQRALALLTGA